MISNNNNINNKNYNINKNNNNNNNHYSKTTSKQLGCDLIIISLVSFKVTFYLLVLLLFKNNHPLTQTKCATPWWVSPCVKVFSPLYLSHPAARDAWHVIPTLLQYCHIYSLCWLLPYSSFGANYSTTPVFVDTTHYSATQVFIQTQLLLLDSGPFFTTGFSSNMSTRFYPRNVSISCKA